MATVNTCARLLAYVTGLVNQELLLQMKCRNVGNRGVRNRVTRNLDAILHQI
jgi:hypothetical protein